MASRVEASLLMAAFLAYSSCSPARANPPLVSDDAPPAEKGHMELYAGMEYQQDAGGVERQVPADEVVYGVSSWQEISFQLPVLSLSPKDAAPATGFGDAVLGTKALLLRQNELRPAVATSFEVKFDNADGDRGLGSGALDYGVRLVVQKTYGFFTAMGNLGRTFIGEPRIGGAPEPKKDVWFGAFAQQYDVTERTALLSEVYWLNDAEPGGANRLAGDVGFKYKAARDVELHAALGRSLRPGNVGGPRLRAFAGLKLEFAVGAIR